MRYRRKRLMISNVFLPLLMGRDLRNCYEVHDGLPPDTVVINCWMTKEGRELVLLLESSEFDEVPDSDPYPEITPTFKQIRTSLLTFSEVSAN